MVSVRHCRPLAAVAAALTLAVGAVSGVAASPAVGTSWRHDPAVRATAAPVNGPLLGEAVHEYSTMTATRYQHRNREDAAAGTYFYDCVGFVTYALAQAAPTARTTIIDTYKIAPGRVPSPKKYVQLFGTLNGSQPGWSPVRSVADLQPGDVVAWAYDDATSSNEPGHDHAASGHAFVVGGAPQASGSRSYLVTVWDSTGTPHGPNDTRRTNPKNLPGPSGKPSGLGTGTVRIDAAADGSIATVHWSPDSGPVPAAHFAMGRPTS
jgi:hypothetical protein